MINLSRSFIIAILLVVLHSCTSKEAEIEELPSPKELTALPYILISSLDEFKPTGANWKMAGEVKSDYQKKHDLTISDGSGILVNTNDQEKNKHLQTTWEHGDLELNIEFLMPQGSNSGIYFQGRYEIQLFDSWNVKNPKYSDCGAVYQRWDDEKPKGEEGYEGTPPKMNASKAPGLWQHFNILFKAPRFDSNGNKVSNARFVRVVHNGVTIHENVEVTGPTRASSFGDEVPKGPLVIQGDHGPVAFRNIGYKAFDLKSIKVKNLNYTYYEGKFDSLPNFNSLDIKKQGTVDGFYPDSIRNRKDDYAIIFDGKIEVPVEGDYFFHTLSDEGSKLFIDSVLVVSNDKRHELVRKSGPSTLTKGEHNIRVEYFERWGGEGLTVLAEGPGIIYGAIASADLSNTINKINNPILLEPESEPIAQRGFVKFQGKKRTHAISVGNPGKVHYSIDLKQGALLHFWKGSFADVTGMWHSRGGTQLLKPMEMYISGFDGAVAMDLKDDDSPWSSKSLRSKGYKFNDANEPVFEYKLGKSTIFDHLSPSDNGEQLIRTIKATNASENLWCRAAVSDNIIEVKEGLYSIDGAYYITLDSKSTPIIRQNSGKSELLFKLRNTVNYSILW